MSLSTAKTTKKDGGGISGFHQDFELIRDIYLLRGLEHECLKILAMLCRRQEYSGGDQLVVQGEDNDSAFLVISGQLDALHTTGDKHQPICEYRPGQFVYGCALLGRALPVLTLKAKIDSMVLCFRREEFQKTLRQFPLSMSRIIDNLMSELVKWDRNLLEKQDQGGIFDCQTIGISLV